MGCKSRILHELRKNINRLEELPVLDPVQRRRREQYLNDLKIFEFCPHFKPTYCVRIFSPVSGTEIICQEGTSPKKLIYEGFLQYRQLNGKFPDRTLVRLTAILPRGTIISIPYRDWIAYVPSKRLRAA